MLRSDLYRNTEQTISEATLIPSSTSGFNTDSVNGLNTQGDYNDDDDRYLSHRLYFDCPSNDPDYKPPFSRDKERKGVGKSTKPESRKVENAQLLIQQVSSGIRNTALLPNIWF